MNHPDHQNKQNVSSNIHVDEGRSSLVAGNIGEVHFYPPSNERNRSIVEEQSPDEQDTGSDRKRRRIVFSFVFRIVIGLALTSIIVAGIWWGYQKGVFSSQSQEHHADSVSSPYNIDQDSLVSTMPKRQKKMDSGLSNRSSDQVKKAAQPQLQESFGLTTPDGLKADSPAVKITATPDTTAEPLENPRYFQVRILVSQLKQGAAIFINGKNTGFKAPEWVSVPAGKFMLKLEHKNHAYGEHEIFEDTYAIRKDSTTIAILDSQFQNIKK